MEEQASGVRVLVALVILLVVGGPLLVYIWHTLSEMLAGRFALVPDLVALALLGVLVVILRLFGRYLSGLADQ